MSVVRRPPPPLPSPSAERVYFSAVFKRADVPSVRQTRPPREPRPRWWWVLPCFVGTPTSSSSSSWAYRPGGGPLTATCPRRYIRVRINVYHVYADGTCARGVLLLYDRRTRMNACTEWFRVRVRAHTGLCGVEKNSNQSNCTSGEPKTCRGVRASLSARTNACTVVSWWTDVGGDRATATGRRQRPRQRRRRYARVRATVVVVARARVPVRGV